MDENSDWPIDPKARGNKFSDEYMGEAISFVSSHEVGHTFGLKHNMGSSFAFPVESLRSKEFTDKMGGTALQLWTMPVTITWHSRKMG
jgi:hypothetical protein